MDSPQPPSPTNHRRRFSGSFVWVLVPLSILISLILWLGWLKPDTETEIPSGTQVSEAVSSEAETENLRSTDGKLIATPTTGLLGGGLAVPAEIGQQPVPERAFADLQRLFDTVVPIHDYFEAAEALGGFNVGRRQIEREGFAVGERAKFKTADGTRQAELIYLDDLAYYWAESGLNLDQVAVTQSAERLRSHHYPLLTQMFGREYLPGVDGDPRFSVLHVLGSPDAYELGYFVDENSYPTTLFEKSNEQEMVYLNMSQLEAGTPLYDGTLVHEIQHLIQWNLDANEETWLNEGLSQIAETLVGLDTVNPRPYAEQPNIRLDSWSTGVPEIYAHYAASYLYLLYFWEQLGDAALQELARHPANGLAAIRAVMAGYRPDISLETFTGDWAVANYLDTRTDDPRYQYRSMDLSVPFYSNRARQLPFEVVQSTAQYAVDYIDLDVVGRTVITFAGDTVTQLVDPTPATDGFWYAVPANSGQARLTAVVDLTMVDEASLEFDAWLDLEKDYDFGYVSVSLDSGQTWRLLQPEGAILGSYGPALNSGGDGDPAVEPEWKKQVVSLDRMTGQVVMLRIEAITDFEVTGRGMAIADLEITGLSSQPVWEPAGFAWTDSVLPQQWVVRLIRRGDSPEVFSLELDSLNRAQFLVDLGEDGGVLVVIPVTPWGEPEASYWVRVSE